MLALKNNENKIYSYFYNLFEKLTFYYAYIQYIHVHVHIQMCRKKLKWTNVGDINAFS